jgi:hypothetical protein
MRAKISPFDNNSLDMILIESLYSYMTSILDIMIPAGKDTVNCG